MHLRTGVDADFPAVGALHYRSRVAAYAHILSPEALTGRSAEAFSEWWAERWRWEKEICRLTVAEEDGEIVGFTYIGPSETPGVTELMGIHVDADQIGTGVGRALMADALVRLKEIGGERAVLWVLEENDRARRFYEKGGWVPTGETRVEEINGEPVAQLRYSRSL
jgi:ribosomal protein S18 acetylase RimI-like enzyme